jgi:hemoglobin-like flavoprotein
MTPKQIEIVKASWREVLPIRDQAAALLYTRLFELDPALRKLLNGNVEEQGQETHANAQHGCAKAGPP